MPQLLKCVGVVVVLLKWIAVGCHGHVCRAAGQVQAVHDDSAIAIGAV